MDVNVTSKELFLLGRLPVVGFGGFKGFKLMDSTAMWFSKYFLVIQNTALVIYKVGPLLP